MRRALAVAFGAVVTVGAFLLWSVLPAPPASDDSPTGFPGEWRAPAVPTSNVSAVWGPQWEPRENAMAALGAYSLVRPDAAYLALAGAPDARPQLVTLRVSAGGPGWFEMGSLREPYGPEDAKPLHRWRDDGDGTARTLRFEVPGGTPLGDLLYVTAGAHVHELRLEAAR